MKAFDFSALALFAFYGILALKSSAKDFRSKTHVSARWPARRYRQLQDLELVGPSAA